MSVQPKIVSFLPAATEMVCALGLCDQLVGISHECDFPPPVRGKAVVVRPSLPLETMALRDIDTAVSQRIGEGKSLYTVDEALLRRLAPDLLITQDLCQVCAPSGNEVSHLLQSLPSKPRALWLTPQSLEQIFENLRELGEATGRLPQAEAVIAEGHTRLQAIAAKTRGIASRPRVFCMEWVDPIYCSGHWVPEMVRIAGGMDEMGREGAYSVRIPWEDVLHWAPEVLVVMPCGFDLTKTVADAQQLLEYPGWSELPAVKSGRVYAVSANSYFARPGPRVVEGTELLAHIFHPGLFDWNGPSEAFCKLPGESVPQQTDRP